MRAFFHNYRGDGQGRSERIERVLDVLGDEPGCRGLVRRLYVRRDGGWDAVGWLCDGCGRTVIDSVVARAPS